MELCYGFLHGALKIIVSSSDPFKSDFVRTYIPACMDWFEKFLHEGVVVFPDNGIKNPWVLVWALF